MNDSVRVIETARDTGRRLSERPAVPLAADDGADPGPSVAVDGARTFQALEGFGGAFTEAAATTWQQLPAAARDEVIRAYFDPASGHGYTLCRTHINSCDFALGNYAYAGTDGDFELKHFSIERDRRALLPMIRAARQAAPADFKLFASPWSPPAWMKTNGEMNHGGKLRPECRDAWARYYCRFIREYAKEGVPVWGLTVQNEPEAVQRWDSCIYTGAEERDFVRDHLGPALHREGLADVRLMIWDHNRDRMFERAQAVLGDPAAARYVWGVAFHWYVRDCFDNVQRVHDAWPDKALVFSEGCQEGGQHDGSWLLGEKYARSILQDLNRWTVGWVDWNLLLDETGGPNHVGNFCSAPIIADRRTGELRYQSSYFYLGHFSRYLRPGARRILCASSRDELEATAFADPDGRIAVVVMNRTEQSLRFSLRHAGRAAPVESPRRSILTLLLPPASP